MSTYIEYVENRLRNQMEEEKREREKRENEAGTEDSEAVLES